MIIIKKINELELKINQLNYDKKKIALVPTMGYLHKGHLSLVEEAKRISDFCIATIFVNPTQFAPNEDYKTYPRDFDNDAKLLTEAGCDLLFCPDAIDIYPEHFSSYVYVEKYSSILEGAIRPTHFRGVATIVLKLFNLCQPDVALFGQKDAQQAFIIQKMVKDLNVPVEIKIMPIIRENDGLAMSSRNVYLSTEQRKDATVLYKTLNFIELLYKNGENRREFLISKGMDYLKNSTFGEPDYIEIIDSDNFEKEELLLDTKKYYVLIAVRFGKVRLIDNIVI